MMIFEGLYCYNNIENILLIWLSWMRKFREGKREIPAPVELQHKVNNLFLKSYLQDHITLFQFCIILTYDFLFDLMTLELYVVRFIQIYEFPNVPQLSHCCETL